MASFLAECGTDGQMDYTMSKHAVLGLMRSASMQLAGRGVRVNCVSPALVATPLASKGLKVRAEEMRAIMAAVYPGINGPLMEKHVAGAMVFLASEDSEFISGHNLVVDGGRGMNVTAPLK